MPIQFQCAACQTTIQTADGTAGKPARCPRCGSIVTVPGGSAAALPASPFAELAPGAGPTVPPPASSPFAPALSPPAAFPPAPLPAASPNPYAPPGNIFGPDPINPFSTAQLQDRARSRLLIPAIGLLIFALTGLGFMALVIVGLTADPAAVWKNVGPDPAEQAGAYGFFIAYFSIGLITRVMQLLGAIAMLRVRGYWLAMAGAIAAVIPCEIYCCIPCLPLGIWALILLNNQDIKAAFR